MILKSSGRSEYKSRIAPARHQPHRTTRHPDARWDACLSVPDPDALAAEFASRGVSFSEPLQDTHDGLRGFEMKDADGYVLFFGRPAAKHREEATKA